MGVSLPKPVETTVVERHNGTQFRCAVAELNGWRTNMEDAHLIVMREDWAFFGVFDGHGGEQCSKWVARRLNEEIEAQGCPQDDATVRKVMLDLDQEFLDSGQPSGSTATMCIVHRPLTPTGRFRLRAINAGDSRVLLGRRDGTIVDGGGTDQGLTTDHKPNDPSERERIERCGGKVEDTNGMARINGGLAVSRGFGDAEYKNKGGPGPEDRPVTADPELTHHECDQADFLLLVCDGVSEGEFPNPAVVKFAAEKLAETGDPGAVAAAVCHKAVETKSKDNITCMMVLLEGAEPEGSQVEVNPGPLYPQALGNKNFIKCYTTMAAKAGMSLAQAAEMRYAFLEEQLAAADAGEAGPSEAVEAWREEANRLGAWAKLGTPAGAKGSAQRKEYFESWAAGATQGGGDMDDDDSADSATPVSMVMRALMNQSSRPGGGGGVGSVAERMELLYDLAWQNRLAGGANGSGEGPKRRVRVAELTNLRAAVEANSAVHWDDHFQRLAGTEGVVKQDDGSDGTSQVCFEHAGLLAWLPTNALTNL